MVVQRPVGACWACAGSIGAMASKGRASKRIAGIGISLAGHGNGPQAGRFHEVTWIRSQARYSVHAHPGRGLAEEGNATLDLQLLATVRQLDGLGFEVAIFGWLVTVATAPGA